MKKLLRIGTRGSKLALWQANYVKNFLLDNFDNLEIELKEILTTGDSDSINNTDSSNRKDSFVKEIEESLLKKEIDIAVHSYKDLPASLPDGLQIISTSVREDPRDVLISKDKKELCKIAANSRIGTGSIRRAEQLKLIKDEIRIVPIRGNVDTRINKVLNNDVEGVVLAYAGVKRLELTNLISEIFNVDSIVPPPLQGFLAIEACEDSDLTKFFENFSSEESVLISNYERQFLKDLELDCDYPAGFCMQLHGSNQFSFNYFLKGPNKEIKKSEIFPFSDLLKQYSMMIDLLKPII